MISISYKMPKAGFENARISVNAHSKGYHRTELELSRQAAFNKFIPGLSPLSPLSPLHMKRRA